MRAAVAMLVFRATLTLAERLTAALAPLSRAAGIPPATGLCHGTCHACGAVRCGRDVHHPGLCLCRYHGSTAAAPPATWDALAAVRRTPRRRSFFGLPSAREVRLRLRMVARS